MQPIIYNTTNKYKTTEDLYNTNGFGFLTDCTEFLTTMEINGAYSFTAKINSTDSLLKNIKLGAYIKAKPNSVDKPQLFYIKKIEIDKNGDVAISGDHVSRLFFQNGTIPRALTASMYGTPKELVDHFMRNYSVTDHPLDMWFTTPPYSLFNFESSISTKKRIYLGYSTAEKFETIFNDDDEGILNLFAYGNSPAELYFDNFTIQMNYGGAGYDNGYRLVYGTNLSDIKQTTSLNEYFTHVMPFAKCSTTDDREQIITSANPYVTNVSRNIKNVYLYDCSSKITKYKVNPKTGDNYAEVKKELETAAQEYIQSHPQQAELLNIVVTVDSELTKMYKIKLGHIVTVVMLDGTELKKKVSKTIFDSVSEKYKEITIGHLEISMSDLLKIQRRFKK